MGSEDVVSTEQLCFVSDHIGINWKDLGRKLDFTEPKLQQFEINNPYHLKEVNIY